MNNKSRNRDLEENLESIEQRIRAGQSLDDIADVQLLGAAEALRLIERVRSQQANDTLLDRETVADADTAAVLKQTPSQIGRFEIKKRIGQGGFGVVFLAFDPNLKREVAIKVPRPQAFSTPELRERFLREGRAAAALTHPNIVPVFESGSAGPICYTASQFVPGESLAEYLQADRPSLNESTRIVMRLADAMEHAHQRGVLHRDIKPANVLVRNDKEAPLEDRVLLTDFGLAKNLDEDSQQTRDGDILGTPAYMSPEQIDDAGNTGPASDIYSLGAMLYELLTGRPPFVGDSVIETLDQVRNDHAKLPSKIQVRTPADLDAICLKCLEKKPDSRYVSCHELSEDLSRFLRHEPVSARRIGPLVRLSRWYRRHKVVATAVSLAFISLILGLVGTLWMYGQSQSNLSVAKSQTQLANRGLDRTQRSIDRMLTDVSQALADQPGMDGLRKRLLNEAREIYQEILNEDYTQQVSSNAALDSFVRIAAVEKQLGNPEQAQKMAQQGLAAYDKLPTDEQTKTAVLISWSKLVRIDFGSQTATGNPALHHINKVIDKLGDIDSTNDELFESLAEAYRQLGINQLEHGKTEEAIGNLESALEVLDYADDDRHSDAVQFLQAQTANSLAIAHKQKGELAIAKNLYQRVVDIMNGLVKDFPERARYQEMRAIVAFNLGNLYFNQQELKSAEASYRVSMEACDWLVILFPDRKVFWDVSARASSGVGLVLRKLEKFDASEQAYLKSLATRRGFREKFGESPANTWDLATAYGGLLMLMRMQERPEEARKWGIQSIELKEKLAEDFPQRPHYKKSLSLEIGNLADVEFDLGNKLDALHKFQEALKIATELYESHPKFPRQVSNLNYQMRGVACMSAVLGNHAEAKSVIDRQAELLPDDTGQIKSAVFSLGSIAKLLKSSTELGVETKRELVESYADQADELMKRAEELGADTGSWLDEAPADELVIEIP